MNLELWKQRKKDLHLNYEQIAELSGVSKRSIEDIFRGYTTTPRIDTVEAIERALGLNEKSPANNGEAESLTIPDKYSGIRVALSEGDKNLSQDDIDDIIRFINFTANKK